MKKSWKSHCITWIVLSNLSAFAACVPAGTAGDDTVICTGATSGYQQLYGGSDHVTLQSTTGNGIYWLDKSTHGDPLTDGEDRFYATDSHFFWVFGFGKDDYFEVNSSTFSNLYADTNPYWVDQRGDDTIIIRNSVSNGWILGGNDNDRLEMYESNVSQVAAGYSDVYSFDYTPYDGNDTVLLDHVNFTETNYYYTTLPGTIGAGKGDDRIEMIHGGEAFNVAGGYGNDIIIVRDGEHFNACSYHDENNVARECGIYGDADYHVEQNVSHDNAYMSIHHGDDRITIEEADMSGIIVNGGHGSDILTIYTPVMLTGTTLDGGDDRSVADTFVDRIQFEQWMGDLNGSQFHNWEQVWLHDATMITLLDSNISTGIDSGVDASSGLPYGFIIDDRSQLNLYHDFMIDGNLYNNAILNLQDGNASGTVLAVKGDYTASSAELYLDTVLNNAAPSISDKLLIEGNSSGTSVLYIDNIGGMGGQTPTTDNSGILVVEVNGSSNGTFTLSGPLQTSTYWYHLFKGSNGNWYLQSELKVYSFSVTKVLLSNADEDGSGDISLGDTLRYEVTATNTGTTTLHHVLVSDALTTPNSHTCASIAPGATCVLEGNYTVQQPDVDAGNIDNTGSADSDETPQTVRTLSTAVAQHPALSVSKTLSANADEDGSGDISLGDTLRYEVTATNTGTTTLHHVLVSDALTTPNSHTCASIAPGATCVLEGNYTVTSTDIDAGKIENIATIQSDTILAVRTNNTVLTGTYIKPIAVDDQNITVTSYNPVGLDILANDIWDKVHCNLSKLTFTQPARGSVVLDDSGTPSDPSDDRLMYIPEADANDITDSFTYTITDCVGQTDSAYVTVKVACVSSQTSDGGDALTSAGVLFLIAILLMSGLYFMREERGEVEHAC